MYCPLCNNHLDTRKVNRAKIHAEHAALLNVAKAAKVLLENTFGNCSANEKQVVIALTELAAIQNK